MQINSTYTFLSIIIVAIVTWFVRGLPYLLFGGKRELPQIVKYLGDALPSSIMIILVVYCIRNVNFISYPYGLAEIISIALIVVVQMMKRNVFLSILLGTACYMILTRTVLL